MKILAKLLEFIEKTKQTNAANNVVTYAAVGIALTLTIMVLAMSLIKKPNVNSQTKPYPLPKIEGKNRKAGARAT